MQISRLPPMRKSMSATGKGTICNMGAEIGATTSTFGYDESMERYLRATGRDEVADAANEIAPYLTGDPEVYADPGKYFDQVIEIDLSELRPHLSTWRVLPEAPRQSCKVEIGHSAPG